MARPRTPIGTFGEIEFKKLANGTVRARTRFRDHDGQLRRIEASGDTRTRAEHRLTEKLAARNGYSTGFGELTPDSPFSQLVDVWLEDLDLEEELAESTRALYERTMRQLVMPASENFLLREISVHKVDQFIKRLASAKSYSTAKQALTVLSLAFGLAVRYDALRENPVRDTARLHKPPSQTMALTLGQIDAIRAAVRSWRRAPGTRARRRTVSWSKPSRSCSEPLPALAKYSRSASAMSISPCPQPRCGSAARSSRRQVSRRTGSHT